MPSDPFKARITSNAALQRHLDALGSLDRRLAAVRAQVGEVPLRRGLGGFAGIAAIVGAQQLSVASANAIMGRVEALVGEMTAAKFADQPVEALRGCGLSAAKVRTLRSIAEAELAGRIDFAALARLRRDEAIAALTALHGVGVWTAEIYLLFHLGHPDIFPAGDLALRKSVGRALDLPEPPGEAGCREIASDWTPHRSAAARLLWRYFRFVNQREGVAA